MRHPHPTPAAHRSRGQTVVFLLMALTILAFVFLWNVDLHRIVAAKAMSQNAGDAAALAAARWQGTALNLVGELNLMHALALSANNTAGVDAATNIQARLCFTGPMVALVAAQVAAKSNRIYAHEGFTEVLRAHAEEVAQYDTLVAGTSAFPEPYPGAWDDYAAMLSAVAADGLAAAPDNAQFFGDPAGQHTLRDLGFYNAIASRDWCWFYLNCQVSASPPVTILDEYTDHTWWPPLPEPQPRIQSNSEIFGLGVAPLAVALRRIVTPAELETGAAQQEIDFSRFVPSNVMDRVETWYFYDDARWRSWEIMDPENEDHFPIVGAVKPEYDYSGADAVVRVYSSAERLTPAPEGGASQDNILWTAAAKPFGYLELSDATSSRLRPDAYGIVLPAFRDVRLIPVDASSGGASGRFDLDWRRHIDEHLQFYVQTGRVQAGCWYCDQLVTWSFANFRLAGSAWLDQYYERCVLPGRGGGRGGGGGTQRGH